METLSATKARSELFNLIKNSIKAHKQYRITHKNGGVILLSEEDYDGLLETLELLSIPGFKKSFRKARREIARGETVPFEKIFSDK